MNISDIANRDLNFTKMCEVKDTRKVDGNVYLHRKIPDHLWVVDTDYEGEEMRIVQVPKGMEWGEFVYETFALEIYGDEMKLHGTTIYGVDIEESGSGDDRL